MPAFDDRRPTGARGGNLALLLLLLSALCPLVKPASAQELIQTGSVSADKLELELRKYSADARARVAEYARSEGVSLQRGPTSISRVQLVDIREDRPLYYATPEGGEVYQPPIPAPEAAAERPSFTGRGMIVGVWDAGTVLIDHPEFGGRATRRNAGVPDDHATHVAGTIAAAGIRPEARGAALDARILSFDWTDDAHELYEAGVAGLFISNHAYSVASGWHYADLEGHGAQWYWLGDVTESEQEDSRFGAYGLEAHRFDQVTHALPYLLPVVAAGNDRGHIGPDRDVFRVLDARGRWRPARPGLRPSRDGGDDGFDTVAGAAVAKNVLTVGSHGMDASGALVVSSFSSMGPTDDGRIKPDLVAPGEHIISAVAEGRTAYAAKSGTSMASARASGTLTLLQQQHLAEWGRPMRSATLKGLVIHTAKDISTPGPDFATGWGALDAYAASAHLARRSEDPTAILESELENGAPFIQDLVVPSRGEVRVTLSWTDAAGRAADARAAQRLDAPTPMLVSDLDLRLEDVETGRLYRPFVLDAARPAGTAATGDNRVDPVEQIRVPDAAPGRYRLTISHKLELSAPQPFSLLVTGASDPARTIVIAEMDARAEEDGVRIRWRSRRESTSGWFRVERFEIAASERAATHPLPVLVGRLPAEGSSDGGASYTLFDAAPAGERYTYRLVIETPEGTYEGARTEVVLPQPGARIALAAHPNPFAHTSTLDITLTSAKDARIEVFDVGGRLVSLLASGRLEAGRHALRVEADNWSAGAYFVRVTTPEETSTLPVTVIR